jgi:hypothetical protein
MEKVCTKMVPEMQSAEQKGFGKEICSDILQNSENETDLLKQIITRDDNWTFTYDPETK